MDSVIALVLTLIAAVALLAIAAVHGYWAEGGLWPSTTGTADLADMVIGEGTPFPSRLATWFIAGLLLIAAALVSAAGFGFDQWLITTGAAVVAGVLALRGAGGLVISGLVSRGSTFARLDRRIYSPLCLALALCAAGAVWL